MMRVAAAMMALLVCGVTTAATINVPADYTTIQAAVDAASNGDEILVAPGTYTDTQDGHVVDMKAKAITLRSTDGAAVTIIDGQNARRGIACYQGETNATVIDGFTITNGFGVEYDYNGDGDIDWWEDDGGGIYCWYSSSPTITDCTITNNTASSGGGGAFLWDSVLTDCTISNNAANYGGGIYCNGGNLRIRGC
ncbi:MAG: hypothetical protein GY764_09920, partial [Halieaceae bacterium]|nr:hypothetical protein [Halieaceae bacterium]